MKCENSNKKSLHLKNILLGEVCKVCGCEQCECNTEEGIPFGKEDKLFTIKKTIEGVPKEDSNKKSSKKKKGYASWSAKSSGYK